MAVAEPSLHPRSRAQRAASVLLPLLMPTREIGSIHTGWGKCVFLGCQPRHCISHKYIVQFLSLHFIPVEPGLASLIVAKDDGSGGDNCSYRSSKAPVKLSPTNLHPPFTGRMPFLSPNQQCQITEGKNITFHGLAYPKLTWGLPTSFLTNKGSWLPWGRLPDVSSAL